MPRSTANQSPATLTANSASTRIARFVPDPASAAIARIVARFGGAAPLTFVGNDTYDNTLDTNPVDSEYFSATQLVTVSQTGKKLVRVSRVTGARGVVTPITGSLPANFFMKGIAREPNPCGKISLQDDHL